MVKVRDKFIGDRGRRKRLTDRGSGGRNPSLACAGQDLGTQTRPRFRGCRRPQGHRNVQPIKHVSPFGPLYRAAVNWHLRSGIERHLPGRSETIPTALDPVNLVAVPCKTATCNNLISSGVRFADSHQLCLPELSYQASLSKFPALRPMDTAAVIATPCPEVDAAPLALARRGACRSPSPRAWRLALGGMLVLSWSALARAEWLFDVDAGARYESNLTRAQQQPDIRGDAAATLFASAGSFLR